MGSQADKKAQNGAKGFTRDGLTLDIPMAQRFKKRPHIVSQETFQGLTQPYGGSD